MYLLVRTCTQHAQNKAEPSKLDADMNEEEAALFDRPFRMQGANAPQGCGHGLLQGFLAYHAAKP